MGERKGVNKYYPPDYDPRKGGLNKSQGTHALRERAKKLHLGILVIRFEMPYNIWCDGCENHIGTGVRYNAEKKKVGMYYTTPIYEFRMKCHLCDNYFDIRTDPANLDYTIMSGARRQERRWDPSENEQVAPEDKAVGRKMAADAMYRREHGAEDKSKAGVLDPVIRDLADLQDSRWEDDFSANQLLRQRFRVKENQLKAQERVDAALNVAVTLLPPAPEDGRQAALLALTAKKLGDPLLERQKALDTQSVFAKMKPKRMSRAAKKDIAKQSIHNIIAAGTTTFDTFKNDFLADKQLGAVVKIKKKRLGHRQHQGSQSKGGSSRASNTGLDVGESSGNSSSSSNTSLIAPHHSVHNSPVNTINNIEKVSISIDDTSDLMECDDSSDVIGSSHITSSSCSSSSSSSSGSSNVSSGMYSLNRSASDTSPSSERSELLSPSPEPPSDSLASRHRLTSEHIVAGSSSEAFSAAAAAAPLIDHSSLGDDVTSAAGLASGGVPSSASSAFNTDSSTESSHDPGTREPRRCDDALAVSSDSGSLSCNGNLVSNADSSSCRNLVNFTPINKIHTYSSIRSRDANKLLTNKSKKKTTSLLPSVTFGTGKKALNFVTSSNNNRGKIFSICDNGNTEVPSLDDSSKNSPVLENCQESHADIVEDASPADCTLTSNDIIGDKSSTATPGLLLVDYSGSDTE